MHELVLLDELRFRGALRIRQANADQQQHAADQVDQRLADDVGDTCADEQQQGQRGSRHPEPDPTDPLRGELVAQPLEARRSKYPSCPDWCRRSIRGSRTRGPGRAVGCDVAFGAGHAHHVADPAQLRVLHLQEVVVRELGHVAARDAGRRPVELHAQTLGQRAIVEVLALPGAAPGQVVDHRPDSHRCKHEQDEAPSRT